VLLIRCDNSHYTRLLGLSPLRTGAGRRERPVLPTRPASWPNDASQSSAGCSTITSPEVEARELIVTTQSVFSNPGSRPRASLNGLFFADAVGTLLETDVQRLIWWTCARPGWRHNNSSTLYGWRPYGDYGIVDSADPAAPLIAIRPSTSTKLLKILPRRGESGQAQSDYRGLGVYAVKDKDHRLNILVITSIVKRLEYHHLPSRRSKKGEQAQVFSYGIPEDEQRTLVRVQRTCSSRVSPSGNDTDLLTRTLPRPP